MQLGLDEEYAVGTASELHHQQRTHHRPMKVRRAHLEYLIRIASGDGTFTVNLHAPGCGRATNHESLAGAFGIPDFKSPPAMGLSQ